MMNPKQQLFCEYYLSNGLNATQAYKDAYKMIDDNKASVSGSRLLRNVNVMEYLSKQQEKTSKKLQIKKEDLIQDLIDIKENNKDDAPPFAIKAIEVINKMLGFNEPERQDITITEQPLFLDDEDEN
jgi:phage terminase small subunit